MSALQIIWTVSILLAAWAVLSVASLLVLRVVRERRLRRHGELRDRLKARVLALVEQSTGGVSEPDGAALGHGFVAVALDLLMQLEGEPRDRLIALMRKRNVDGRLRQALQRFNQSKRQTAAEALRFFPSDTNRRALDHALHDKDTEVRLAAAASLIAQGVVPPLTALLPHLTRNGKAMPVRLGQILRDYCERDPEAVVATVRDRAIHPFIRAKAVETLAGNGNPAHVSAIQPLVLSPEPDLRAAAVRAFAKLPNPRSRDAIAMCLRDESWFVRAAAADTAGRLGLYELVPLLVPLVDDEEWWVRFRASEALETLDAAGRAALREMAKIGSDRQRRQAALTLSKTEAA
jgi:HEAT repeat protein